MIQTLRQYCEDFPDSTFDLDINLQKISTQDDTYYDIFYYIVYLFLKESEKKKRCLCLHGAANTGKSTIAKFLKEIFSCHDYRTTNSVFQQELTMNDAHIQLLVIDECTKGDLFSKKQLAETKRLLEGDGMMISNKQKHPFNGFKNCFTFMTMNTLPYPYNEDKADATEGDMDMKKVDQSAFNARMKRIHLEHSYKNTDKFPLTKI